MEQVHDEIKRYLESRYASAPESIWRIYGFKMHEEKPSVIRLDLHLSGYYKVNFREGEPMSRIMERARRERSSLTAFFRFNEHISPQEATTYIDFPRNHVYHVAANIWTNRSPRSPESIGRIFFVQPAAGELYYLRMLLNTIKGPKSFESLRPVRGQVHPTFKSACNALGLLQDDNEWYACLEEAAVSHMPSQLRSLFAIILIFCAPVNPELLWETYRDALSEDQEPQDAVDTSPEQWSNNAELRWNKALICLEEILQQHGKCLRDFPNMPEPWRDMELDQDEADLLLREQRRFEVPSQDLILEMEQRLNEDQRVAYQQIKAACEGNLPH